MFYVITTIFLGIPSLLAYWVPRWKMRWMFERRTLGDCDFILAEAPDHQQTLCPVFEMNVPRNCVSSQRFVRTDVSIFAPQFASRSD